MNHRFQLRREWNEQKRGLVNFIMLNPSTADDTFDDPTIRKCVGFAKRWGFSGIAVTNLFAYRATDPNDLWKLAAKDMSMAVGGGDNLWHIEYVAKQADAIVCAWGNGVDVAACGARDIWVCGRLLDKYDLFCIRRTKTGNPAHPVREPYTDKLEEFMYKRVGVSQ